MNNEMTKGENLESSSSKVEELMELQGIGRNLAEGLVSNGIKSRKQLKKKLTHWAGVVELNNVSGLGVQRLKQIFEDNWDGDHEFELGGNGYEG